MNILKNVSILQLIHRFTVIRFGYTRPVLYCKLFHNYGHILHLFYFNLDKIEIKC